MLEIFSWKDDKRMSQAWVLVGIPHLRRSCDSAVIFSWPCVCATCWYSVNSQLYWELHVRASWRFKLGESGVLVGRVVGEGRCFGLAAACCVPQHCLDTRSSPVVPCYPTSSQRMKGSLATSVPIPILHACINFRGNPTPEVYILVCLHFVSFFISLCQQSLE